MGRIDYKNGNFWCKSCEEKRIREEVRFSIHRVAYCRTCGRRLRSKPKQWKFKSRLLEQEEVN